MSIPTSIVTALTSLVSGHVYPSTFPQVEGGYSGWPAIRYTVISSDNEPTICGTDNSDATDDVRVQIDAVAKTYLGMVSLRNSVISAVAAMAIPSTREGLQETYDAETKTHRAILDFVFLQSS